MRRRKKLSTTCTRVREVQSTEDCFILDASCFGASNGRCLRHAHGYRPLALRPCSTQSVLCSARELVVRSPFRARHHVVVQYMAAGPKCPLPPGSPRPPPWTTCSMTGGRQGEQGRIDEQGRIYDITNAARDFALQLP